MRVVVTGGTGNVGSALVQALERDDAVEVVTAVARRLPATAPVLGKTRFVSADITSDDLTPVLRGADAVVHLAWALQPAHDRERLARVNVRGSERLLRMAIAVGVPRVVVASSIGAYLAGPRQFPVAENWPIGPTRSSTYSRHKVALERICDRLDWTSDTRIIRMRPSFIFQRGSAMQQRRLFVGGIFPPAALQRRLWPVLPWIGEIRFQALHADDAAEGYRLALHADVRGAFNLAADPPITGELLGDLLERRVVRVPYRLAHPAHAAGFALHVVAGEPGWLDLAVRSPLLDTSRARDQLGWAPARTSIDAILELAGGMRDHAEGDTPPLAAD
jgi:nucleoside-diphosphate-sugar epimerase